jgi:hypothetical protein
MRLLRWTALAVVVGAIPLLDSGLRAADPVVTFHTIGDLDGVGDDYTFSTVRDATKVGSVIYAVGGSAIKPQSESVFGPDTPILWTRDGTNDPVLTALPAFVDFSFPQTPVLAQAITRDARYIASMARDVVSNGSTAATRVTTSGLATLNLSAAPYTVFTTPRSANAIAESGLILYGNVRITSGGPFRAARFDINAGTTTLIPTLGSDTTNAVINRGTSADGSVMVGTSGPAGDVKAFRYKHGVGASAIPRLAGGTFNRALAVSANGNLTLVSGNSPAVPNGEIYIYDTTVEAAPTITKFGSPNSAWQSGVSGGITADGAVTVVNYVAPGSNQFGGRFAYFHNSNGWFHLEAALGKGGLNVLNLPLRQLVVNGISPDGTLVYGQGLKDTEAGTFIEGFVAEFPANFLAEFDVPAVPPGNSAIVGAWYAADTSPEAIADPTKANPVVVVFLADGSFFHIEANHPASQPSGTNGFERGRYRWDGTPTSTQGAYSGAFSAAILHDTNGDIGFSGFDGVSGATADVVGDILTIAVPGCANPEECSLVATRVTPGPFTPLVGGWIFGNPLASDSSVLLVLLGNGDYYFAQDGSSEPAPVGDPNGFDGIEKGTWAWNAANGAFSSWTTVDTNGQWGLNSTFPLNPTPPGNPNGELTVTLSPDGLRLDATNGVESFHALRVAIVAVETPTGPNVDVTPTTPSGETPVTIQFDTVTSEGETTLQLIDPSTAPEAPAPPAGFQLGDPPLYYEIDTTATFTGPVTVCFDYAGVTFSSGTPRLLHFDEDLQSWVDITSSLDEANSRICGITSSFSPFAIAASQATTSGFAPPISPVGSYQNVVKGGSTVALKFNVSVNGVEMTNPDLLTFSVVQVGCTTDIGETPVPFETTGGTSLRYAGGQFVQNWKTPTAPGCYFVRVTGEGLLLNAVFKVR